MYYGSYTRKKHIRIFYQGGNNINVVDRSNLINHRYGVLVTADIDNDVVYLHIFDGVKTNQIIFYRETPDDKEFCSSTIEYLKRS